MWELKIGDVLGDKYTILEKIGQGGFGVVYKVFASDVNHVKALKTLRPDLTLSDEIQYRYIKEAEIWVEIGRHPFIVLAHVVEKIDNRVYIVTDYVEPDSFGLNSLESYLLKNMPDLRQTLTWAIQFCLGIEHAYSRKIKAHRDIKPANIMIDKYRNVRINDFGLAGILSANNVMSTHNSNYSDYDQTRLGVGAGTPSYMAPEQFVDVAGCDQRSDIYSFGVVLYQMTSGGILPFDSTNKQQYWQIMKYQHETAIMPTLNSPIFPQIRQCMEKKPWDRIQTFAKLREELEVHLKKMFNEEVSKKFHDPSPIATLVNRGFSLNSLGRHIEAIECFDRALALKPTDKNILSTIINNKAASLHHLARYSEALLLYDKVINIDNNDRTWYNKGNVYLQMCNYNEAIYCYDVAIGLNPELSIAYYDKAVVLYRLKLYSEALTVLDKSIEKCPIHISSIALKGEILYIRSSFSEAMTCFEDILRIDSNYFDALHYLGTIKFMDKSYHDALKCFEKAVSILPAHEEANQKKAEVLIKLSRFTEAIDSLNVVLENNPNNIFACKNMAFALFTTGNYKRALIVIDHALSINITDKWAIDFKKSILAKLNPAKAAIPANIANNDSSIPGKLSKFLGGFLK